MDLGLRTSGYTFEEIAQSIGYKSASGDLYAVEKALDRVPAPEVHKFRKLNLGRLNPILRTWWPLMVGDRTIADRAVATDRIRGAIHDIRQLYGLDVPIPKEPTPGSTRDNSLHVSAVPGQIDWDAIPDDLAEEFLAFNDKLLARQPGSGGLLIDESGTTTPR